MKTIAVTMGDPSGIGPEVLMKALATLPKETDLSDITFRIYGDKQLLERYANEVGFSWSRLEGLRALEFWTNPELEGQEYGLGALSEKGAFAQVSYIQQALQEKEEWDVLVTGPIHKNALMMCGLPYVGHTDWLGDFAGAKEDAVMMLAGPKLRVVPATIHIPLKEVSEALSKDLLKHVFSVTARSLQTHFGIDQPRIAVCGLNPHAGDGGMLGKEEQELISPLIHEIDLANVDFQGPFPADSLFYFAQQGQYDAVIGMYHDQVLTPLKMLHFEDAINITLGLPFLRASVDHGPAYPIAGKQQASEKSMVEALSFALKA